MQFVLKKPPVIPSKSMLLAFLLATALHGAPAIEPSQEIVVQNRILTKVNEKTISVLDVMKQMDVFLSRYYPQYMQSKPARYQFYLSQWRQTLQQMVDNELMVADAESREVKVSDGEVREEIQLRFGPNVMASLDTLGISYEEARKMVHQEMVVQRIQWLRVTAKALQKVTSQEIKEAYENYLQKNPAKEELKYQFLSIRCENPNLSQALGFKVAGLMEQAHKNLLAAADLFKEGTPLDPNTSITVSQEFVVEERALSQMHKEILRSLKAGEWSPPTAQTSRDGSSVVRIFHLIDRTKIDPPSFETIANDLKQELLGEYVNQESGVYLTKLHQRFGFDESALDIPPHFEPFTLR